jgi:hypothetical protein
MGSVEMQQQCMGSVERQQQCMGSVERQQRATVQLCRDYYIEQQSQKQAVEEEA